MVFVELFFVISRFDHQAVSCPCKNGGFSMKTFLAIVAAVGLSATAAAAECSYHKVSAEADVDRSMTTASIATDDQKASDVVLLKKRERLPEDTAVTE
jgi:hypothetical protein